MGPGRGRPWLLGKADELVLYLAGAGEPVVCVQGHGDAPYDVTSSLGPM